MVRLGNNLFQSIAGVVFYTAVLATITLSIAAALGPLA